MAFWIFITIVERGLFQSFQACKAHYVSRFGSHRSSPVNRQATADPGVLYRSAPVTEPRTGRMIIRRYWVM
jgi:hypothetical protein